MGNNPISPITSLSNKINKLEARLAAYQDAINKIDDYFEYRAESKSDQEKVHEILGELREELGKTK